MEANCKKVIETIAPQQESHDATEPIGPLSPLHEKLNLHQIYSLQIWCKKVQTKGK